jgi:hypothetical protein
MQPKYADSSTLQASSSSTTTTIILTYKRDY